MPNILSKSRGLEDKNKKTFDGMEMTRNKRVFLFCFFIGGDLCKPEIKEYMTTANTEKHKLSFIEIVDRKRALP
jgi:hypothetical protein